MDTKKLLVTTVAALAGTCLGTTAMAQLVGGNSFMKGTHLEVGISACGTFGTSMPVPAGSGFHSNAGDETLGFVADAGQDGWGAGAPEYCGDYFVPGTPEEGWNLKVNGNVYSNHNVCSPADIPGSITGYSTANNIISTQWMGNLGGLSITKTTYFPQNALYFVTQVTITNNGATPVNNVYYMRNVDPDNEQPWTYDFRTINTVVSQPTAANNYTGLVKAEGLNYGCFLGLGTKDSRAKVTLGGFSNRDPELVYNAVNLHSSGSRTADEAISLAFNLGNLAPNQSVCFSYAYILNEAQLAMALQATQQPVFKANGVDVTAQGTFSTCQGSPVSMQIEGGDAYNWTWTPAAGLSTATGTTLVASPASTTTYTATGTSLCGTVTQVLTIQVLPNTMNLAVSSTGSCTGTTSGTATAMVNGGTAPYTYLWSTNATTASISGLPVGTVYVQATDNSGCRVNGSTTVQTTSLNVTAYVESEVTAPGVNDGYVSAFVTGGTAPFSFTWDTNPVINDEDAMGLAPGTYTVTVTDATGCTGQGTVTLGIPTPISASIFANTFASGHHVSCNGAATGTADLTVTGGTAPYTYAWSNGATSEDLTNVMAGTYSVQVTDANGNQTSATVTLTQPAALVLDGTAHLYANGHHISCYGTATGEVTTYATGGVQPYTYLWTNGTTTASASNFAAGIHTLTVTDANGCAVSRTFALTQPAAITVNAGNDVHTYYGYSPTQCTTLNGSSNGGYGSVSYNWSNNATTPSTTVCPSAPTAYTLTVTDAMGCQATDEVNVEPFDIRCGNGNNPKVIVCHNTNNNPHEICISVNAVAAHLAHGCFLGPCNTNARLKQNDAAEQNELSAAPNPFSGSTNVSLKMYQDTDVTLEIFDYNGRLVEQIYSGKAERNLTYQFEVKGDKLQAGIYLCRLTSALETTYVKLVLVK